VIIPVYNAEKFLVETIESVLNQSLKEFELILINDGSVDDSASICEEYQNNDSRIQYFSQ
ncbi:glycosyltransferase family 2 protein, partial [Chryseobacterium sp. CH1]